MNGVHRVAGSNTDTDLQKP